MVWSNWRGAVVVMLAWVGLARSQAPVPTAPVVTGERIMTVHENGTSLRCRIVSTWRTPEGSQAYQLQAIDSGETLTIVEDGPAASFQEATLAGKVKALPMRIFHWGRSRVAPSGVPMSPEVVTTAEPTVSEHNAAPISARPTVSDRIVSTRPAGNDQIVWWEEKNGVRVSPMIVTGGKNPFEQQPTVHTLPGTNKALPVLVDRLGTTSPLSRPIVKAGPSAPATSVPITSAIATTVAETPQRSLSDGQKLPSPPQAETAAGQVDPKSVVATPYTLNANAQAQNPYAQTGPTPLSNTPQAYSSGSSVLTQPVNATDSFPTTAAAANYAVPTPAEAPPTRATVMDKLHNWLHPKRETTVVRSSETKQFAGYDTRPRDTVGAPTSTNTSAGGVPFSTAADPGARASSIPPPASVNTQAMVASTPKTPPTANAGAALPTSEQGADNRSAAQATPKKDWRTMWGQPKESKVQVPGQSLVEQASARPGATGVPLLGKLPPTSTVEDKSPDILLNPEKFDPSGARMIPRGIHMNAYRGDPASLLTKDQHPTAAQNVAQTGSSQSPLYQAPAVQPPPLPGIDGGLPPGARSVLAASANSPGNMTYVPVPVNTIPDPSRTPGPPAPRLPEPPQPNAYVNAFTPQGNLPPNPATANAFSGMDMPANGNPMAQRYPQAGPNYLPDPYQPNPIGMTAQGTLVGIPYESPPIRQPMCPIAWPIAAPGAPTSRTRRTGSPRRRAKTTSAISAPMRPP